MNDAEVLKLYFIFIPVLLIIGLYCIIVTRNLIRALIGLEILTKAVTLLLIVSGFLSKRTALTEAMVITLIIIEVVIISVAAGIILNVFRRHDSLDTKNIENMKG